jgi:cytoskeletal protein CcmA (bactofilin family)
MAHIGKSVLIKGELSGSEDLYLDGEVEGSVELKQHSLTVGPHGQARANLNAREVIIHGKVDGNVSGEERVELKKSAVVVGDISTQRILIEDGAFFKARLIFRKREALARNPWPLSPAPARPLLSDNRVSHQRSSSSRARAVLSTCMRSGIAGDASLWRSLF